MKSINKYILKMIKEQFINTHEDASILSVEMQNGIPRIWITVDTEKPKQNIQIGIYETGKLIPSDICSMFFINTIVTNKHEWHVFQIME